MIQENICNDNKFSKAQEEYIFLGFILRNEEDKDSRGRFVRVFVLIRRYTNRITSNVRKIGGHGDL